MVILLSFLSIFLVCLLESSIFPVPLTVIVIVCTSIFQKQSWVFFLAIVAGILLDSLLFRPLGSTSLFFLAIVGAVFLYSRKFETNSLLFIAVAVGVSCFFYALLFVQQHILLDVSSGLLLIGLFFLVRIFIQFVRRKWYTNRYL